MEGILVYLCAKANVDPLFFYNYEVDHENHLGKLLWANSRSQMDYIVLGDVVSVKNSSSI